MSELYLCKISHHVIDAIEEHSDLSLQDLDKTIRFEFWYDFIEPKYDANAKLCYMDTDSFIVHLKTERNNKDIAEDVEAMFGILN